MRSRECRQNQPGVGSGFAELDLESARGTYTAGDVLFSIKGSGDFAAFRFHSELNLLPTDDIDAMALPEPGVGMGLLSGTLLLATLHKRRSRLTQRRGSRPE